MLLNKTKDGKNKSVSFSCELVNDKEERVFNKNFNNDNTFTGFLTLNVGSNQDLTYEVILLNNYKQINFAINDSIVNKTQTIIIPKTKNDFFNTKVKITTKLTDGLNNYLMIFIDKSQNSTSSNKVFNFYKRFTAINTGEINKNVINYSKDYEEINYNFKREIAVNAKIDYETKMIIPTYTLNIDKSNNKLKEIPIAINVKSSILDSPFYNEYVNDEKLNKEQSIAVLAISNGQLLPLYYESTKKENVKFYNVKLGKTIIIYPQIDISNLNNNQDITFLVIPYPLEKLENLLKTYKATNWSTIISETITISIK